MKALLNTPLKRLAALATESGRHRHVIRACGWVRAWIDELIDLLPVSMRRRMVARASLRRILWPLPSQVARASATLVLPYSEVMAQTINLPVAAAADLMRVMSFEIDRYRPSTLWMRTTTQWASTCCHPRCVPRLHALCIPVACCC
jgi:hypothetical protein